MTVEIAAIESTEHRAWRDWRRVEACLLFGGKTWGVALLALWLSDHWLAPLSEWLSFAADAAIITVWLQAVKRINARMEAGEP